ncbi:hypothetical protein MSMTP_1151 [Methanosarcina sp. MTP4]|nr:hypothetical protein MSMTP_1151 [Methanosarcina sp. MTP4]
MVYKGVLYEDSFENYLSRESTSICQFLYFLCIDDIAKHVERTFYTNKSWHFKYSVSSMIKLFVVKCFRKLSYDKTISSLTEEEAILLSFFDENGQIKLPSGGTLHHFVKYRLGEEGINEVMMLLGEKILKLSSEKEAKIDSTPLEASRYDKYADYNPHYECKMDKAHITMIGTYPVFMTHTKGVAGDSPELIKHIETLKKMNADVESYSADGGYDSFLNHSDIWYHLNAKPIISYASNAVINQEGEEERIDHWVNKMWKIGGDVHTPMAIKLKFLYENGREEQVGMYLRNQNISDESFDEQYKKRAECEKIHGHIKDVVKFDIRRIRNESKKLYSLLNLIAYQLLVLTELQNKVKSKNSFGRYF